MTLFESIQRYEDRPDTALRFGNKSYSYRTFLSLVRKAVSYLRESGIGPGDVVTAALPNIPANIVFFYALNAVGAVQNIVHPLMPMEQILERMRERGSRHALLLATAYGDNRDLFEGADECFHFANPMYDVSPLKRHLFWTRYPRIPDGLHLRLLDRFRSCPEADTCGSHDEESDSVYLYSGGTTGVPKVIALSDRSINRLAEKVLGEDGIVREDLGGKAMLAVLPTFHGFGLGMGVHAPLYWGACADLMMKFDAGQVVKWIRKDQLHMIIGVPLLYQKLLKTESFASSALKHLTHCFVGGDHVQPGLIAEFDELMERYGSRCRLLEGYGLTETVTVCCVNRREEPRIGSVGKPLRGIEMDVLDENGERLPAGRIGELFVAGDTLMNGYLGDAEATEATLMNAGGRVWVRTGDLGFRDEDGYYFIKGRKKRLFIISGINVYPSEVEKAACESEDVYDAAMEYFETPKPHMILYVLKSRSSGKTDAEICAETMARLEKKVIKYSMPRQVVVLTEFPKTRVGKIDHGAFRDVPEA